MTFNQYLNNIGLTVEALAEMPLDEARRRLFVAFPNWAKSFTGGQNNQRLISASDLLTGWDLAVEVMAYKHMAQDVRSAAEADQVKQ